MTTSTLMQAAVGGLIMSAAATYAKSQIRCNCVAPGLVGISSLLALLSTSCTILAKIPAWRSFPVLLKSDFVVLSGPEYFMVHQGQAFHLEWSHLILARADCSYCEACMCCSQDDCSLAYHTRLHTCMRLQHHRVYCKPAAGIAINQSFRVTYPPDI